MDDELQQLEAELKTLRPAPPRAVLVERLAQELDAPDRAPRRLASVHWVWAAVLPAAAAVAIMIAQSRRIETTGAMANTVPALDPVAGDVLKPVAAENVLVAAQDEGLVTLEDGTPARRARLKYVDTITWKNPRTNASLTWTVPREEVRVVPVSFQ